MVAFAFPPVVGEVRFDLIAQRWLPQESVFHGNSEVVGEKVEDGFIPATDSGDHSPSSASNATNHFRVLREASN